MEQVITKEKRDAVALRWLQLATGTSGTLSGIHVNNGQAESSDGYRIHLAPTPDPVKDAGIVRIRDGKTLHKTPGRVYEAEEIEGVFPDVEQIDPDNHQEPQAVLNCNPKYLREALEMPNNGTVTLRIYSSTGPFTVTSDEYKAVIMPKHPTDPKTEEQAKRADNQFKGLREMGHTLLRIAKDEYYSESERLDKMVEELKLTLGV